MSIVFDCPACNARLSTQSLGKHSFQCPKCSSPISLEIQAAIPLKTPTTADTPVDTSRRKKSTATENTSATGSGQESTGIDLSILSKPVVTTPKLPIRVPDSITKSKDANLLAGDAGLEPAPGLTQIGVAANSSGATLVSVEEPAQPDPDKIALTANPTSVHIAILKRKRRQSLFFFITNSILGVLILAISGTLYWKISAPAELPESVRSKPLLPASASQENESAKRQKELPPLKNAVPPEPGSSESLASVLPDEPVVPGPVEPPKPPVFDFFSKKQISEIWKRTKPHLVQLSIDGPYGKQQAVGLIVDSRGWLLTSYQAVKDATRIEVTAALEPLDQQNIDAPLVDLVRGRVIDDPQHDLAILSINRRFVISLAEASIAAQDRLVVAQRILVAAPPSITNYWGVCEANIAQRSAVDRLPLSARSRIELTGIGTADLSWLTLEGDAEWLPGTPLLDQAGTVQAMVSFSLSPSADASSKSLNKRAIAVPLATLKTLIQKASGNITPLASDPVQTKDGESAFVPENHASKKQMAELNLSAMQCREFGWIAETDEHYQQLAHFAKQLIAGQDFLLSDKPDYRTPAVEVAAYEQVEKRLQELTDEFSARIQKVWEDDPALVESLNRFAEKAIISGKSGLVPMVAKVIEGGLQLNQFIVQIDGQDTYCAIPFDPLARPLRPGTYWWLVVETKKSTPPKKYSIGDAPAILAHSAFQKFEIGPLKPK